MRLLFDGFWWGRGPYSNRQVLREFILGWERQYPDDELVVAVPRAAAGTARAELPSRVELMTTVLRPQGVSAILELPLLARRAGADVVLTHNFSPLLGRSCVFVHDLMFETNPEWFTRKERLYFSLMTATLPRADLVLTSSRTEAQRIQTVGRPRRDVVPVGLGVPSTLTAAAEEPVPGLDALDGFLILVGRLNVRKNLVAAVEGALASGRVSAAMPVLVIGESSGKATDFPVGVRQAADRGEVRILGFVSDAQLAWLYRRASLFMFLSLDEGFGLPAVEAMAFGTPVVASDIAIFHEVLRDHATYTDPHDVAAIGTAVAATLDQVRERGRPRPVEPAELGYSWAQSVSALRAAVASVVPATPRRQPRRSRRASR